MRPFQVRSYVLAALVAGTAPLGAACYVEEDIGPPVYAYGYEPVYYDGYVVYYDGGGRPYYYVNGAVAWVPPSAPIYPRLVEHYHVYGGAYTTWHSNGGYRYRGYRYRR
jgi:hypothetical protein